MTYISFCQIVSVVIQADLIVVAAALNGTGQWGDANVQQGELAFPHMQVWSSQQQSVVPGTTITAFFLLHFKNIN